MHNCYLLHTSFSEASNEEIQDFFKFLDVCIQDRVAGDEFHYSSIIYGFQIGENDFSTIIYELLPDIQFMRNVLPRILTTLKISDPIISSVEELNERFADKMNSYIGCSFPNPENGKEAYYVFNNQTYALSRYAFFKIGKHTFWDNRHLLFDKVKFTPETDDCRPYFVSAPNSSGIIERLITLENFYDTPNEGGNPYLKLQEDGLNCSPDSETTLKQFSGERTFTVSGNREVFSWHIKLGDTRIYFLNKDTHCEVGYIGTHLRTVKFK